MEELETAQEIFKVFLRGCPTYTMKLRIKLEDYVSYQNEIGEKKRNWMKSHTSAPLACGHALTANDDDGTELRAP